MLCNIGLVITIWVKPGHMDGPGRGEQPRNMVISKLKFSDEQVKQYDALIALHQDAMHRLHREAMDSRTQLFATLSNPSQNSATSDSLAAIIAGCQKKIELVTYNHFAEVRKICTDAQKAEFDKIIADVIKQMNGNQRGGPPPGDHGEGPDHRRNGPPPPPPHDRPGPPENE